MKLTVMSLQSFFVVKLQQALTIIDLETENYLSMCANENHIDLVINCVCTMLIDFLHYGSLNQTRCTSEDLSGVVRKRDLSGDATATELRSINQAE